jgi:hypothetical protein
MLPDQLDQTIDGFYPSLLTVVLDLRQQLPKRIVPRRCGDLRLVGRQRLLGEEELAALDLSLGFILRIKRTFQSARMYV